MNDDQRLQAARGELERLVHAALARAKQAGADQAEMSVSHSVGLNVTVRLGEVETVEHSQDKGFGVTVYCGQRSGSASTTDVRESSIYAAVDAACRLAQYTEADPYAGLADPALLATEWPELSLYHPWDLAPEAAIAKAIECEALAMQQSPLLVNSEGASLYTHSALRVYGNSHGFVQDFLATRHGLDCAVIAEKNGAMQRDYSYTVARAPEDLDAIAAVAKSAAERTVAKLDAQVLSTREVPVIFAADVATSLVGHFLSAISGSALYRQASFLVDHLGQPIFPEWLNIMEDPFVLRGLASCPYDAEGVRVQARHLIEQGVLQGYLLDSYSARKLKMQSTGNAGGAHNIVVQSRQPSRSLAEMLALMDTGLLVTDVMGQGVNVVTGDYSRGANGFWVEKGKIQYPVEEITIAGHLRTMFQGLQAIGSDIEKRGRIRTGSILIDRMQVAGASGEE